MQLRLRQDMKVPSTGEAGINTIIAMAGGIDCIYRSTRAYGKEETVNLPNNHKKQENSKNQLHIKPKNLTTKNHK